MGLAGELQLPAPDHHVTALRHILHPVVLRQIQEGGLTLHYTLSQ